MFAVKRREKCCGLPRGYRKIKLPICQRRFWSDTVAAQKHLALQGVPSLGYCGVAPPLHTAGGMVRRRALH